MKKILCINPGISYLSEIEAYKKYFNQYNIDFIDSYKELKNEYDENDYDLLWYMMGTDFKRVEKPKVHDYASMSTGGLIYIKDKIKKYLNTKPDLRLFLNTTIKNRYEFNDDVPFLLRDMGIDKSFFIQNKKKEYDFVYIGAITEERKIPQLLEKFKNNLTNKTLLIIGDVPENIYSKFNKALNITFTGKLSYNDVPKYASKAIYGINMIPNTYPFNVQTSTKLLEYCALSLKIITTKYAWEESFESKYSGAFFKIDEDLDDFDLKEIEAFEYSSPNVNTLEWNKLFDRLDLISHINKILNQSEKLYGCKRYKEDE